MSFSHLERSPPRFDSLNCRVLTRDALGQFFIVLPGCLKCMNETEPIIHRKQSVTVRTELCVEEPLKGEGTCFSCYFIIFFGKRKDANNATLAIQKVVSTGKNVNVNRVGFVIYVN